jgi:hypothetical protein
MIAIPSDSEALKSRGLWLGFAYLKASGSDVRLLFQTFSLPEPQKSVRNRQRIEMATYYLSKWSKIVEPVLREQFSDLSAESISVIKQQLEEGALSALAMLVDMPERNDLSATYRQYVVTEAKTSFWSRLFTRERKVSLWSRLRQSGFSIDISKHQTDLDRFEKVVIGGTVLCCMLDSLSVSQEQIEQDHERMLAAFP